MATTEFSVMTINAGGAQHAKAQIAPAHIAAGLYRSMSAVVDSPDIIAVQESHHVWTEDSFLETSRELARNIGESYSSYFSPYIDSKYHTHQKKWGRPAFKGFLRVKQGNAIITNKIIAQWPWDVPPEGYPGHTTRAPITTQISRSTVYSKGNRDTEPRSLMVVPLSVGQISLYCMVTHLATLTGEDRHDPDSLQSQRASDVRLEQVEQILRVVDELRKAERRKEVAPLPIILAGDFNAQPGSPELDNLEHTFLRPDPHWHDGSRSPVWTHTGHKIHVDHIVYSDPAGLLTLLDCFVLLPGQMTTVTDHLPVIATFTVTADSTGR
jgi:endonuclease/exonuclease/phosphatase family metal-dependent hydrolase